MSKYNIEIGKGLGAIHFGQTKQEVKALLGDPTDQDLYNLSDEEDGFLTETWHFDEAEISLSFDEEDNWRLTTITTSHGESQINGKRIMNLTINDLDRLVDLSEFGACELDDLSDGNINQKCYSFIERSLNLWFVDDRLTEIQWGVLWEDEDTPLWP